MNISSLKDGRLDLSESDHVSAGDFARWTKRVEPEGGDLLFSYETRLGDAALMPAGVQACLGRRMALLRPDRSVIDPRFLLYMYLAPDFQATIEQNTIQGATVNRIPLKTMGEWGVRIPVLGVQRAIANVLSALDDKIAANAELATTADALALSLVREASAGRPTVQLGTVARITMGSSPTGDSLNEGGVGAVFYQGVRDFGMRFPTRRIWTTSPTRWAGSGDILLSVRAPVGEVNIAPESLCIGRGLAAVRSLTDRQATLAHLLRGESKVWEPYEAEGTVFGSINRGQLHGIQIPMIDEDESVSLETRIQGLEARIASALRENEALSATRDVLLPAFMSGRLAVRNVEATVDAVVDQVAVHSGEPGSGTLW